MYGKVSSTTKRCKSQGARMRGEAGGGEPRDSECRALCRKGEGSHVTRSAVLFAGIKEYYCRGAKTGVESQRDGKGRDSLWLRRCSLHSRCRLEVHLFFVANKLAIKPDRSCKREPGYLCRFCDSTASVVPLPGFVRLRPRLAQRHTDPTPPHEPASLCSFLTEYCSPRVVLFPERSESRADSRVVPSLLTSTTLANSLASPLILLRPWRTDSHTGRPAGSSGTGTRAGTRSLAW